MNFNGNYRKSTWKYKNSNQISNCYVLWSYHGFCALRRVATVIQNGNATTYNGSPNILVLKFLNVNEEY